MTAYTPPYVSDQYYSMMALDGAGNATIVPPNDAAGATHTSQLSTDCWAEWVVSLPELMTFTALTGQIKLPEMFWYHGYGMQLTNDSGMTAIFMLRNDNTVAGGSAPVTLQANFDHVMRIEARGADFKLFLDGVVKLDWIDSAPLSGAGSSRSLHRDSRLHHCRPILQCQGQIVQGRWTRRRHFHRYR